jgi:hypothetical protein
MGRRSGAVLTARRAWLLGLLAVGSLLGRFPWADVGLSSAGWPSPVGDAAGWLAANRALAADAGLVVAVLLVWTLLFLALPGLYPTRARELTATVPFRACVAGLTTLTATVVVLGTARRLPPVVFPALAASTLVVVLAVTSRADGWRFPTPYVSPTFAILSSFVPTTRVTDFAALFRRGTVDGRVRLGCQSAFGLVVVGFVLVVGALSALPVVAFPALELLTLGGLCALVGSRLSPALPVAWRLRCSRAARRARRHLWTVRRLLADPRGTASALLVTTGLVLGSSAVVLAVAVAAAAGRTPSVASLAGPSAGVLVEWSVAGALLGHALTVGWFWWRTARWLPTFLAADRARREAAASPSLPRADRPPGLLLPQTGVLVTALVVRSPAVLPGTVLGQGVSPAVTRGTVIVAMACLLAASLAVSLDGPSLARLPRVPDRLALPAAFAVQWLGTSLALAALPGTRLPSLVPTTVAVLVVALGGYFYVDAADAVGRRGWIDGGIAYLVALSVAVVVLAWAAGGLLRRLVVG